MATQTFIVGDEQKRCPSAPSCPILQDEVTATIQLDPVVQAPHNHSTQHFNKRPTLRHVAKRKSSGARYMRRSTSMEDTTKHPSPLSLTLTPNPSPIGTNAPSIVSSRSCAQPIAQAFHATASPHLSFHSPAAQTLRSVTHTPLPAITPPPPTAHRTPLLSHFIHPPPTKNHESYQTTMENEYRTINHYLHPMQSSLYRCLVKKKKTWESSEPLDQRRLVHRTHLLRVLDHPSPVEVPSPKIMSSPASFWDRVWNHLVNT